MPLKQNELELNSYIQNSIIINGIVEYNYYILSIIQKFHFYGDKIYIWENDISEWLRKGSRDPALVPLSCANLNLI